MTGRVVSVIDEYRTWVHDVAERTKKPLDEAKALVDARLRHTGPARACEVCFGSGDHNDHRIPTRFGGRTEPRNRHWLCYTCHLRKTTLESSARLYGEGFDEWFNLAFPTPTPSSALAYLQEWNDAQVPARDGG